MQRIEISDNELALIEKHLAGKFSPFFSTEEEQRMFTGLIEKAEALEQELDALDERMEEEDCDLLRWYLKKWEEQEKG